MSRSTLSKSSPVFTYDADDRLSRLMMQMVNIESIENIEKSRDIVFTGLLYQFFSLLIENSDNSLEPENRNDQYVKKAIAFIHRNYSNHTSISEIARVVGLERKYFSSVFKSVLGISPQSYLIKFRINKACQLIPNKELTIGDIARSVGYTDQFLFSKVFKKLKGCSPKDFKNSMQ